MKLKKILFKNLTLKQTVAKNFFWLSFSQIFSKILRATLFILAARILGPKEYGNFAFALSLISLFLIFGDLGLSSLITREFPRRKENLGEFLSTSLYLKFVFILFFSFVILLSQFFIPSKEIKVLIFLLLLMGIFENLLFFFYGIFRGKEEMEKEAFIFSLETSITFLLGISFLFLFPSAKNLALAYLAGSFLAFLASFFFLKENFKNLFFYFQKNLAKKIALEAFPFAFAGFIGNLLTYLDVVMIGFLLKNSTLVGIYSAPLKIIRVLFLPAGLLATSLLPVISKKIPQEKKLIKKSISFLFLLAFPLSFGGFFLSKEIILFLFGSAYLESTKIFSILIFLPLLVFPTTIFGYLLFAYNLQRKNALFSLASATLNFFLNLILILRFGIVGAASATLISQFFNFILFFLASKNLEKTSLISFSQIKNPLLASLAMSAFILILKNFSLHLILTIFLSALFYLLFLFLLKEPILKEIKEIFKKPSS